VHAPTERHVRPYARAHLSDEATADEQLVTGDFRLGGILAQGWKEEL
jgi:hypothetical protein